MFGKKKKDNKLTVEIVTYNQGQSSEHFGLAAVEKEGKRKETRPLQAAPKWKTKASAARWAKKNGYNLNDIKELPKDIPTKPKKDAKNTASKRSESKPVVPKKQQANVIHKDDKELVIRFKTDNSAGKAGDMITVKKGEKGWSDGKHNYFVSHLRNSDFIEIIGRGKSAEKPAAPKNGSTVAKKSASAKKSAVDKLLQHSDKDEMNVAGEKPIVINGANVKPKPVPKVLRRVAKSGGYTAWDDIKKNGKTFATEQEAKDYAADVRKKTGKIVPISPTDRQVTHTFRPEEEKKKK